jgi:hypothetical protein
VNLYSQRLSVIIADLTECLCALLASEGAGPTCFCGLVPGEAPAWDYCGECAGDNCGMGFIVVQSVFPSTTFPGAVEFSKCDAPLAAGLQVGALRCVPTLGEQGELPDETDQRESGLALIADMGAIHKAIACCGIKQYALGSYVPLGPTGGCAGGAWELTVGLDG